jgi:Coenzyme PQQ synthesis protein D (PqqD)
MGFSFSMNISRLRELTLNDNGFAFDPRTGLTYMISPLGMEVIHELKNQVTTEETLDRICRDYDVQRVTARQDLENFVSQLKAWAFLADDPQEAKDSIEVEQEA